MANTVYLKKEVEPFLFNWASGKLGVRLSNKCLVVGKNTEGQDISFEFDGVSDDNMVGVCVSCSISYKRGQMRKLFMDATLLNRVPQLHRRVMVFIRNHVWEGFKNECDGMVDLKNIEPLICKKMPPDMQKRILDIYNASAEEVGDKSGPGVKVPGRRA